MERDNGWIKNKFGEIVTKENIDSFIPQFTSENASNLAKEIREQSIALVDAKEGWEEYFAILKGRNQGYIVDLIKNTDDLSKLTGEDLIKANEAARKSAIDHNAALKQQTLGAKAAAVGMKLLKTVLNSIAAFAISQAISAIISRFIELVNAFQNGLDKLDELSDEINSLESEMNDLNNKLSETKLKINELESLPKLTFLQKEELEELRQYNDELERQKKIKEAQIESDKSQQNKEAQSLWSSMKSFINTDVKPVEDWDWTDWLGNFGTRNSPLERLANLFQKNLFSDQIADLGKYEEKLKELRELENSEEYKNGSEEINDKVEKRRNELENAKSAILKYYGKWNQIVSGMDADDPANAEALKALGDAINKWDILSGKIENTFKGIYNSSNFATVKNYLDDLAAKGELTVEKFNSLTENDVKGIDSFREALKNVEDLTVADVVESINLAIEESGKQGNDSSDGIKNLAETFDKLYDSIDKVLSKQEKLADAFKKMRLGAKLTIQEVYELIKEMPSLAQYISKDGDGYSISDEGFEAVSKENNDKIKEEATKELDTIRNKINLLEKEKELKGELNEIEKQLSQTTSLDARLRADLQSQYDKVSADYENVSNQCQNITDSLEDLTEAEKAYVIINDLVNESFKESSLILEGVNEAYDKAKNEISNYNNNIKTIDNAIKTLKDGAVLTYDEMNALVDIAPDLQDSFEEQENGYSIVISALEDLREQSYETRNSYIDDKIAETKAEIESVEALKKANQDKINEIVNSGGHITSEAAKYIFSLSEEITDLDKSLKPLYDIIEKLEGLQGNIEVGTGDGGSEDKLSNELQNRIDYYKTILSAVEAVQNKYTEAIDKEIDALNDSKDALKNANDERQRELDLIDARNNLENAKKRKVWVYTEGKGFQQVADEKAVKEAEEDYRNAITDVQEAEIDKKIEELTNQKEQLENANPFADFEKEFEDAKTVAQALKALGLTDESDLLNLSENDIEKIKNGLAEAINNKEIEDNKENDQYIPVSLDEVFERMGVKVSAEEAMKVLSGVEAQNAAYNAAVKGFSDALNEYTNNAISNITNNGGMTVFNNNFEIHDASNPDAVAKVVNQELTNLFTKIGNSIK